MAASNLIETTQVSESRSTDLAAIRSLGAIADQEHSHLTLGGLDGSIGLTGRHRVALCEEEEVVDQSLHVLLHGSTGRRRDLVILNTNGAGRHLVQALVDDAERLAEFLHTAEVTVVAVAVDADRDVEFNLVIGVVGLGLADVPWDTGATEHDTRKAHVQRISGVDDTDPLGSHFPDTVICEQFLGLIDAVTELRGPLIDIVQETKGKILSYTTRADISRMKTGAGNSFIEFLFTQSS